MRAYVKSPSLPQGLTMEIDPAHMFRDINPLKLIDACGFIPGWIVEGATDPDMADMSFYEIIDSAYQFGMYPFDDMYLRDDLTLVSLKYPEDAPYHPYMMTRRGSEYLIQFDHALLAFITPDGEMTVVRCD